MCRELTAKQESFIHEYVVDFNGTDAAIRAGYSTSGASVTGCRLLTEPRIAAGIKAIQQDQRNKNIMQYDEACSILSSVARGNVADYLDIDGRIDNDKVRNKSPEAIQSIEIKHTVGDDMQPVEVIKFRMHDRIRAIERLAKLLGWDQPTKTQVEATVTNQPDLSKLTAEELVVMEEMMTKAGGS